MIKKLFLILILVSPVLAKGQTDYINFYEILNLVIKKEKLNKSFGIQLEPASNNNINYSDTSFLRNYLEKSLLKDSILPSGSVLVYDLGPSAHHFLSSADMNEMLMNKKNNRIIKWDNKLLGFNSQNKTHYYTFSIPFINATKDKIILDYDYYCPGLCGHGSTIALIKRKDKWEILNLSWRVR